MIGKYAVGTYTYRQQGRTNNETLNHVGVELKEVSKK